MEYVLAFLIGALVGGVVGALAMGLLVATREEVERYR
jgi:gas vesicle protein